MMKLWHIQFEYIDSSKFLWEEEEFYDEDGWHGGNGHEVPLFFKVLDLV